MRDNKTVTAIVKSIAHESFKLKEGEEKFITIATLDGLELASQDGNEEPEVEPIMLCSKCANLLAYYEAELENDLATYLNVCKMFQIIKMKRLYRETHSTFSAYFDDKIDDILGIDRGQPADESNASDETAMSIDPAAVKAAKDFMDKLASQNN